MQHDELKKFVEFAIRRAYEKAQTEQEAISFSVNILRSLDIFTDKDFVIVPDKNTLRLVERSEYDKERKGV